MTFYYDANHNRVEQVTPSGTTIYLNMQGVRTEIFMPAGGGTSAYNSYVMAGGQIVDMVQNNGPATAVINTYFHTDHLGSTILLTDDSGAAVKQMSYDPWGKRRNLDGSNDPNDMLTSPVNRGFTGQEELHDSYLTHMNARVYDPQIGKFSSGDPSDGAPISRGDWNRYAYVGNNPLNSTDPTGMDFPGHLLCPEFCSTLGGFQIVNTYWLHFSNGEYTGTTLHDQTIEFVGGFGGFSLSSSTNFRSSASQSTRGYAQSAQLSARAAHGPTIVGTTSLSPGIADTASTVNVLATIGDNFQIIATSTSGVNTTEEIAGIAAGVGGATYAVVVPNDPSNLLPPPYGNGPQTLTKDTGRQIAEGDITVGSFNVPGQPVTVGISSLSALYPTKSLVQFQFKPTEATPDDTQITIILLPVARTH